MGLRDETSKVDFFAALACQKLVLTGCLSNVLSINTVTLKFPLEKLIASMLATVLARFKKLRCRNLRQRTGLQYVATHSHLLSNVRRHKL